MLTKQFFETTRGRIVALLRRGPTTVDDLSTELGITRNAVRAHVAAMRVDGLVRRVGQRAGATRPSHLFELTGEAEQLLSRAYIPFLTQVVNVFANTLPADEVERVMREVGKGLSHEFKRGRKLSGRLEERTSAASELMNQELGALTRVEHDGGYRIVGDGCPLAGLTGKHPAVCLAIESMLADVLAASVHECCDRSERPRCCFEITSR
jgi:DeoR family transcriptional regulator, suf operon transcriptional repressor